MIHGKRHTKAYSIWCAMKTRCNNPNASNYHDYGGRGISVCDRWNDFAAFYEDMGDAENGMTLERIDTNGNYEPDNCRWATMKEQGSNKRNNVLITANGKTQNVMQWAEETGIDHSTIRRRLRLGWNPVKAVSLTPKVGRNQHSV